MNSLLYDTIEDSLSNLLQNHSLTHLLQQDREQLITQSYFISYYHPNIDRDQAEQLLKTRYINSKIDGLFLIRNCTTSSHDYSLSLIYNDRCYHYKIQLLYDIHFSIDSGPQIAGIDNLIRYYQERADGLICILSTEFIQGQPLPITIRCIGTTNILHQACKQGKVDIVQRILSSQYATYRPDISGKDSYGSTALHEASYYGHDNIVRLLIKAGGNIRIRDANGSTALHRAAAGNRPSTLLILINEGLLDYEERNYKNYWVPLHEAAFHNSTACVQVLLDCGAPLRPRTNEGKTPLQLAEENQCIESILILRQYKTSLAKSSRNDWLHDKSNFDRFAAKQLIESVKNESSNGMFIVRHSSKNLKNYALTLYNKNEFFNFEIICLNETTFYIDDGPYFDSLEHLIDHYCRIPDGLPITLTCSVNQSGQLVSNPLQPLINSSTNNKPKETSLPVKHNISRQTSADTIKTINRTAQSLPLNPRTKFPSSLSSSITSLNSSSSRSRASSAQESPLSTSSSNASLSSTSPSKPTIIPVSNDNGLKNRKLFFDRRKTIDGKTISYLPDLPKEAKIKRLTMPIVTLERQKPVKLNFISPDQIQQIAKLGEGEFGEVYEGFYQENSIAIPVAMKVLKDYSYAAKQDFLREAKHMSQLNHPCICKLYGIVDSHNTDMMMVIELLLLGSMVDYLWKHKLTISEYRLKLWASQIADGMEYMEYKGIVHRDLAARNILLQSIDQVKISDFGLSRCIDTDIYIQRSDSKIPVKWYAPEAISIGRFTSKSDVWSFGITLWEMFSYSAAPYGDRSGNEVYYSLKQGNRLERPLRCPLSMYHIMLQCWEWDEQKRPTFYQLVRLIKNEFITGQSNKTVRRSHSVFDEINNERKSTQYRMDGDEQESKKFAQL
ncbi:unnamed protein product [Adineta steineri]|uniref:Tyrosine-protein kinase n=1 Tax=Adineta steineri TaxID=433720 RepID=A0A815JEI9_9BILA|nr:unnamed protein product [Adineta steineri]CAF3553539.1 unnamed protein product [Adineta steineri]